MISVPAPFFHNVPVPLITPVKVIVAEVSGVVEIRTPLFTLPPTCNEVEARRQTPD